ncbi:MAG: lactate utilization protein C [Solirubrobacteraceae bacterium]
MSDARAEILGRVRSALGDTPVPPDVARDYRPAGAVQADVDLFCERVADYRATVHRVTSDSLGDALAGACRERGAARLAVPSEPPADIDGVELVRDEALLAARDLDGLDGVLTGCALGIAETGTIVLDGGGSSGRRALTLVPDYHLCVVREAQIVASVPDAVARLAEAAEAGRPITLVSGPSATSDIELERVEGVHGPRTLDVFVVAT